MRIIQTVQELKSTYIDNGMQEIEKKEELQKREGGREGGRERERERERKRERERGVNRPSG